MKKIFCFSIKNICKKEKQTHLCPIVITQRGSLAAATKTSSVMKATVKISVPKVLRYAFLLLAAGAGVLLLLNLSSYFGISSSGPFLRGEIATQGLREAASFPLPDNGELRVYDFKEQKLVMLDFNTAESFFQLRHMVYLFFQNMTWVLAVFILYQMYRIFQNLDRRDTFREDNTRRIRWIALAVLFYPLTSVESALQLKAIVSRLPGHGLSFSSVPVLTEQVILGGLLSLVIFALAEVFRTGVHLQQEQDLTI